MKTNPIVVRFILIIFVGMFSGCFGECWNKPGAKDYRELVATIEGSNTVAVQRFARLPVDQQITVALYARDCPDDPRIRPYLIMDGEAKIPAIVERIKTEKKLWDKEELALVLISINTKCRCITRDSDVVRSLEAVGDELEADRDIPADYTYKQMYKGTVKALKEQLERR